METEIDQFDGTIKRTTGSDLVQGSLLEGTLKISISQYITPRDTVMLFFVMIQPASLTCFDDESKILMKAGERVLEFKLTGKIDCASKGNILVDSFSPSKEDAYFLRNNQIEAIRVYYAEGYGDFDLKKESDYFIRTLKCFE